MSYLVLARKYRPQTFADLVGQEQISRTLKNALATGRVAHAYLFSGPRGVGKTTAARLLAMSLSCLAEDVTNYPCGLCQNCLEIKNGQAIDVIEVDGASNRGIVEIRDLRETVKYLPGKSRYKVYIIDEVHALTRDAFGALLKTLEEPPSHVVFIFATTETHKVPLTILSRCQRYEFRRIRVEDITRRLITVAELEKIPAEPAALEIIARQAEGGLRDSLSLLDQAIVAGGGVVTVEGVRQGLGLIDQALVQTVARATLAGDAATGLAVLDEAYLRGYDLKDLGLKLLEYVRGLTLLKVASNNARILDLTETEEFDLLKVVAEHSLETLNLHFDAWLKFQRDLGYSSQPRWLLEAQIVRLSHLARLTPLVELVERLDRLLEADPPPFLSAQSVTEPSLVSQSLVGPVSIPKSGRTERVVGWPEFLAAFQGEIETYYYQILQGARVVQWSSQEVKLVLDPVQPLPEAVRKTLTAHILPLLSRALGGTPTLILVQAEAGLTSDSRLAKIQDDPEIKKMLTEIPGDFVDFIPASSEEIFLDEANLDDSAALSTETSDDFD